MSTDGRRRCRRAGLPPTFPMTMSVVENPHVEALLREAAPRKLTPLTGRERLSEALFALGAVAASGGLYALGGSWSFPWWLAIGLLAMLVAAKRIDFRTGSATAPPSQLAVVSMLVLLPPVLVPLLTADGYLLGRADSYLKRSTHPD